MQDKKEDEKKRNEEISEWDEASDLWADEV